MSSCWVTIATSFSHNTSSQFCKARRFGGLPSHLQVCWCCEKKLRQIWCSDARELVGSNFRLSIHHPTLCWCHCSGKSSIGWTPHGACAHYVMVSKFQWAPFWLATQRDPQSDRLDCHPKSCELWRIHIGPIQASQGVSHLVKIVPSVSPGLLDLCH